MNGMFDRVAIVIGASSGIGEAVARELHAGRWRLGLIARRLDRLEALAREFGAHTRVRRLDVTQGDAATILESFIEDLGGVDLIVVSAGTGHLNPNLISALDHETIRVNVEGFMAMTQVAMRYFLKRGRGHLAGISSIAALRGGRWAAAYAASKAFQSVYLDGLRDLARNSGLPITITEIQPGFVDTAMMKTERRLSYLVRRLLVCSPATAARQIVRAIQRRADHAYITRRYGLVAFILRLLPRPG